MAEIRYRGPDPDGMAVNTPAGLVRFGRMEWVDIDLDTARRLAKGNEDFELKATVKAAKTRKANEAQEGENG